MKSLNCILDETTLLNFPFLGKLVKRYYGIVILLFITIFLGGSIIFYSQKDLYLTQVDFTYLPTGRATQGTSALKALIGDSNNELTSAEIIQVGRSMTMFKNLAEKVYEHVAFKTLNFNPINSKVSKSFKSIFRGCENNKYCYTETLMTILPSLYTIELHRNIDTKYVVKIKTEDRLTAEVLKSIIPQVLVTHRLDIIKNSVREQIKISEELIKNKQKELEEFHVTKVSALVERNNNKLQDVNKKIDFSFRVYSNAKNRLDKDQIQFFESKKSIFKKVSSDDLAKAKEIKHLKNEIQNLKEDVTLIQSSGGMTIADTGLIKEIKANILKKTRKLQKLDNKRGRSVSSYDKFLKKKDNSISDNEFNVIVAKKHLNKLRIDYETLLTEKNKIIEEREKLLKDQERSRPSFELLKIIQEKHMQLKLLESTIVSDFVFDKVGYGISKVKTKTITKVFGFSFALFIFASFVGVVLRYLFDSRIFDEEELKLNFNDLEIIGNTPDFD